jgi:hypothetical protein
MGFAVTDVHAAIADLKKAGVVFEEYDAPEIKTLNGVTNAEGRSSEWFKDIEGNIIELLEFDER